MFILEEYGYQVATIEKLETSGCIASDPQTRNCDSDSGPTSRKIIMIFCFFFLTRKSTTVSRRAHRCPLPQVSWINLHCGICTTAVSDINEIQPLKHNFDFNDIYEIKSKYIPDNLQVDRIFQCVSATALLIKEMCRER